MMGDAGKDRMRDVAGSAIEAFKNLEPSSCISLESIQRFVSTSRGRPIRIVEFADLTNDTVCGLWLVTDDTDIILHAPSASRLYTQQFILHELAHMILRHDLVAAPASEGRSLLPDIPNKTVRRMLARDHLDDGTERAAEILADLLASSIRGNNIARSPFSRVFV